MARVVELVEETPRVKSVALEVAGWTGHRAGQHVDVRLTAEDGYQAQRSYSIASAPEDPHLVLTVERLEDGEVSPYLVDVLGPGDELELRGPIGGYFVWDPADGPALLVAGGSGVVPFRAMLRHRAAAASKVALGLLYSARSSREVIFYDELTRLAASDGLEVRLTLTREWPEDWSGVADGVLRHRGRIDRALLAEFAGPPGEQPLIYICGPTGFVENAAETLVETGHEPALIRTERFGATGS